ncbi:hypothetical protein EV421DRAFT_1922782 [Armillaria borealis]|uniref:SAP domain-containing protein n=1 Tax=Armillaria borealis TaxID=47425 RepID=A0AA39K997_9AGAR|nr:hypothetical protein EV421DRAFT_1922782 [Armillaria borealis]
MPAIAVMGSNVFSDWAARTFVFVDMTWPYSVASQLAYSCRAAAVSDRNATVIAAFASFLRALLGFFTPQVLATIAAAILLLSFVGILGTMAIICSSYNEACIRNATNELPFPTRDLLLDNKGLYIMEYHNLKAAGVGILQQHCKHFKLTYSGLHKKELIEKLAAFSLLGQEGWKEHKTELILVRVQSTRRRPKFPNVVMLCSGGDRTNDNESVLPARSKDNCSIEQIEAPIIWAQNAVARYRSEMASIETFQHSPFTPTGIYGLQPVSSLGRMSNGTPGTVSPEMVSILRDEIQQSVTCGLREYTQGMDMSIDAGVASVCSTAGESSFPPPADIFAMNIDDHLATIVSPMLSGYTASTIPPSNPHDASNPPSISQTVRVLQLGGGRGELHFTDVDVPPAPLYRSAKNIDQFAKMWDNDSCLWAPTHDALHIKGIPVPVKLFPAVYQGGSGTVKSQWSRIKNQWSLWHYILTVYMSMSPEEFWVKFRNNAGSPMTFTVISDTPSMRSHLDFANL